jgi:ABC-type polysaccharide/polyol phosphate export permease
VVASILGLGLGMIFCGPTVKYRDLAYILPVGIQLLLFLMPVGYGREAIPERWLPLYDLNPVAPWIDAARHGVVGSGVPELQYYALSLAVTCLAVIIGITRLERSTRYLADVL